MVLQVRVIENHQNGKDTHVRGLQVFSVDERVGRTRVETTGEEESTMNGDARAGRDLNGERGVIVEPDWMRDLELR